MVPREGAELVRGRAGEARGRDKLVRDGLPPREAFGAPPPLDLTLKICAASLSPLLAATGRQPRPTRRAAPKLTIASSSPWSAAEVLDGEH